MDRWAGHAHALTAIVVEAIAGEKVGMKEVAKRTRVASDALERAAVEHAVDVAHLHLLLVGHVVAAARVEILLHAHVYIVVALDAAERGAVERLNLGRFEKRDGRIRTEWIHIADDNRGKHRLLFAQIARGRGHLVLAILRERFDDQPGAHARVADQHQKPYEREKDVV